MASKARLQCEKRFMKVSISNPVKTRCCKRAQDEASTITNRDCIMQCRSDCTPEQVTNLTETRLTGREVSSCQGVFHCGSPSIGAVPRHKLQRPDSHASIMIVVIHAYPCRLPFDLHPASTLPYLLATPLGRNSVLTSCNRRSCSLTFKSPYEPIPRQLLFTCLI